MRWPKPGSRSQRILRYFMSLFEELFKENDELKTRVKPLENPLATHSSNRSKPPSQRGLHAASKRKDQSLHHRSGKKRGGQLICSLIATAVKQGAAILEELVKVFSTDTTQYRRLACTPEWLPLIIKGLEIIIRHTEQSGTTSPRFTVFSAPSLRETKKPTPSVRSGLMQRERDSNPR